MLKRGGCPLIVKVRNAQNIGASAVLIVNDIEEDINQIVIIDNGTAGDIFIPSYIIPKTAGDKIAKYTTQSKSSELTLTFERPKYSNAIEYTVWMTSANKLTLDFLHDFAQYGVHFSDKTAKLTPHYRMLVCESCKK